MSFVETGVGRLRFRERAGAGTPVVFVHGAGAGSGIWLRVLSRVGRRALAMDLPGHGQSEGAFATLDQGRDAVGAFCAAACVGRAVLVGHSMGGALALAAALAWPDKVAGLVMVASSARFSVSAETLERVAGTAAESWLAEMGFSPETSRDEVRRAASLAFDAPALVRRRDFALLDGVDLRERLGELAMPVAIIGGRDDLLTPPARSEELARGIRGAQLTVIAGSGHFPHLERPREFHAALDELLARVP